MARKKNIILAIPVGTKVRMINCLEAENPDNQHIWETRSEPWQTGAGDWIVALKGKAGGFSLEKLELAEE